MSAEDELWRYAVALYGRDGVAPACLALQDEHGADVPLLLWALWRAGRGEAVDAAAGEAAIGAWREEVVRPLRALRRRLKTGPAPGPDARSEALRDRVKAAELEAERVELATLALLPARPAAEAPAALARANLEAALALRGAAPPLDAGPAATLLAAAEAHAS